MVAVITTKGLNKVLYVFCVRNTFYLTAKKKKSKLKSTQKLLKFFLYKNC